MDAREVIAEFLYEFNCDRDDNEEGARQILAALDRAGFVVTRCKCTACQQQEPR